MKIVATVHRSAGNDSVGHMWKETKIFGLDTLVSEIIKWARGHSTIGPLQNTLELTVAEEFESEKEEEMPAEGEMFDFGENDIPF